MRKLLARPSADPPLSIDADLRPEGKGGALIRSLSAYRNYYSRWSSTWELQALVRADALAGEPRARRGVDGRDRRPPVARERPHRRPAQRDPQAQGPGRGRAVAAWCRPGEAHQARTGRPRRRRVDGADAAAPARPRASGVCGRPGPSSRSGPPGMPASSIRRMPGIWRRPGCWPAGSATRSCWSGAADPTRFPATTGSSLRWPSCSGTGPASPRTCWPTTAGSPGGRAGSSTGCSGAPG